MAFPAEITNWVICSIGLRKFLCTSVQGDRQTYERSVFNDYSELRDRSWLPVLLSVLTFSSSQYLNKTPDDSVFFLLFTRLTAQVGLFLQATDVLNIKKESSKWSDECLDFFINLISEPSEWTLTKLFWLFARKLQIRCSLFPLITFKLCLENDCRHSSPLDCCSAQLTGLPARAIKHLQMGDRRNSYHRCLYHCTGFL